MLILQMYCGLNFQFRRAHYHSKNTLYYGGKQEQRLIYSCNIYRLSILKLEHRELTLY
jgi:hypothetical protein